MRFSRTIHIANPKKGEKFDSESFSNGTFKPMESENEGDKKDKETGKANEGFEETEAEYGNKMENSAGHSDKNSREVTAFNEVSKDKRKFILHRKTKVKMRVYPGETKEVSLEEAKIGNEERKKKRKERSGFCKSVHGKMGHFLDHPRLIHWLTLLLIALATWCIVQSIAGSKFLPGSQLFSLMALFVLAYLGGALIEIIKLPALLGMLLMGLLLRNVGFIHLEGVYTEITATLREVALCIILIRAGLGLDPKALKSLRFTILRVASIPGIVEALITMTVTHFLLNLPWLWGLLLGAILAAVSPAVVIPCLFSLQERGYGTEKGIPTLVVAAASLDDILAITGFGIILNIIYSTGKSLTMQVIQGPLGILLGAVFGIVWGFVVHFVPHQKDNQVVLLRVLMITGGGLMAIIGSRAVGYQGAGPLGCIIAAFVACLGWRKQDYSERHNPVADVFRVIWTVFQPILFGLIGSEVDVSVLEMSTIGNGLLSLFCSLLGRIVVTIFVSFGAGFSWMEKTFIAWAWFPKATVQAALGPLALDIARRNGTEEDVIYSRKILVLAVLAILITAPIGSALITILGPRLLTNAGEKQQEDSKIENVNENHMS